MSRLGQADLHYGSYRIGTIWVRDIVAEPAFWPRLKIDAGCQLKELEPDPDRSFAGLSAYGIENLHGVLRWKSETGSVVGDLWMTEGMHRLRSRYYAPEEYFTMCCNFSMMALGRLEADRGRARPIFFADLEGEWRNGEHVEHLNIRPWKFTVPEDRWLAFLVASGFTDYDYIEIRKTLFEDGDLSRAINYLNGARELVLEGRFGRAVGTCRLLIEAIDDAFRYSSDETDNAAAFLEAVSDPKRANEYKRILASIKQLSSLDHHDYGQDSVFSRAEAQYLIRTCEALLVLLSDLSRTDSA